MTVSAPRRAGPAPARLAAGIVAAGVALAALSLLMPSVPSYDPFAWLVWGRELVDHGQALSTDGGPSWKPLPVLFTAPFAVVGGAAPDLWLLVARAGALLALVGAFALGRRLGGAWAGALAVLGVLLLEELVSLAARGASEPLLLACVLWAIERHLAGRRGSAFALGVAAALIRPEAWPFLGVYAVVRWREAAWRERWLIAAGLALVPLLWLGPPAVAGDPFAAGGHAARYDGHTGSDPGWTALRRGAGLAVAPVWALALAAVALRPGDRVVRVLALGAVAWLALVVAMTSGGFPGLARFMLPAAAVACVLAGVGAVALVERAGGGWRAGLAAVALVAGCGALGATRAGTLGEQVRDGTRAAGMQRDLTQAIAALGGRAGVLRCAGDRAIATNHTAQSALAWKLDVRLDRVAPRLSRPGIVFRGPSSLALGEPPPLELPHPWRERLIARAGVWRVMAVLAPGAALPAGCKRRV